MSTTPGRPLMPPVPRDHDDASYSEMVPFRSTKINLKRSPLLLLAILTALVVPFLFALLPAALEGQNVQTRMGAVITMNIVVVLILTMILQLVIFFYSRTDRPIWVFLVPFMVVAAIILFPPLARPYFFIFREILPGDYDPAKQYSFIAQFVKMFFAAGLCEELMKATPILFGAFLTLQSRKHPGLASSGLFRLLHVRGPLDAAVMGTFAGGGFIFIETGFEYVPTTIARMMQQTNDPGLAMASGIMLLLPRTLGGLVGHMAYAGIFGYFIGLAVIRPRQMWKLLAIGWLLSSTLHALWNSVTVITPLLSYLVAIASAVIVVGAILKARQMEASLPGRPVAAAGSIVVERPRALAPAAPAFAAPMPAPASPIAAAGPLSLDVDGLRLPLRSGATVDLGREPALDGRGAGVIGAIVAHPTREHVLGLRNTGTFGWTARLRDGSRQIIGPEQNIRLAPGVEIEFGPGLTGRVVGPT